MIDAVMLDSGPLGKIVHARANLEIAAWMNGLLTVGVCIILPEVIDYEQRRKFLHKREEFKRSLQKLDKLKDELSYLPLDTWTMNKAAELWADARIRGRPDCDDKRLDVDAILAAQAIRARASWPYIVVATENVKHLKNWVDARECRDIQP